jgi:uncharacterized membrane protein
MTDSTEPTPETTAPATEVPAGEVDTVMCVLSYLGILALIPYLTEKDPFIQWHARQGLVFAVIFFLIAVVISILGSIVSPLLMLTGVLWLGWLAVTIIAILKALKGEKWPIPVVSGFIDKLPERS